METPTLDLSPLSDRVASYGKLSLLFPPGTAFSYGNADVNTAAYVVEKVSGMPYETFLKTRLLDPLGMKDTTFCPTQPNLGASPHPILLTRTARRWWRPPASLALSAQRLFASFSDTGGRSVFNRERSRAICPHDAERRVAQRAPLFIPRLD